MTAGQTVDWATEPPEVIGPDYATRYRAGREALEEAYREHPEGAGGPDPPT